MALGLCRVFEVAQCADRGHRHFRRSVDAADCGSLEIPSRRADQRWRHRCAAADENLEIRQPRAGLFGGGQQADKKRSGSGHVCAALGGHQRDGGIRVPTFHQNRRRAQQQGAFEGIDGSADVCDRRRDQENVAVINQPVVAELRNEGVDRIMGVQNALRPACGAGRVEDHAYGVRIQYRQALAALR